MLSLYLGPLSQGILIIHLIMVFGLREIDPAHPENDEASGRVTTTNLVDNWNELVQNPNSNTDNEVIQRV